jgi:hypothetical protein
MGKQHNQSKYIEDLVMNDISSHGEMLTRDEVIRLIVEHTGSKKINTTKDDCVLSSIKNLMKL